MPLTDTFLKTIKYSRDDNKPQREYDTEGLYLEITPKGVKKWQMKYKRPITGKENRLSFGIYPEVSLKEARLKRDQARKLLQDGKDPSEAKKEEKRLSTLQANNTFEAIANEWLSKQSHLAEATLKKSAWLLSFAVNSFGQKAITDIIPVDVLAVCRIFENQNKRETAKRIKVKCSQVFKYAVANSPYVFPSIRSNQRTMSENTINAALRRLGYTSEQMCGHGFRAMARTILDEVLGYPIEVIEMQLAHAVKDANGRAYNRTKYREQRHKMMQHWSDYLDGLQANNVVAVKFGNVG